MTTWFRGSISRISTLSIGSTSAAGPASTRPPSSGSATCCRGSATRPMTGPWGYTVASCWAAPVRPGSPGASCSTSAAPTATIVRIRADSLNQPFDINAGAKLQLGSTAKLRTLITYLDIVDALHRRLAPLPRSQLLAVAAAAKADPITRWAAGYLADNKDRALAPMLDAAMRGPTRPAPAPSSPMAAYRASTISRNGRTTSGRPWPRRSPIRSTSPLSG